MKKIVILALVAFALVTCAPAFAASTVTSGPYNITASVDGALSMSVVLYKNTVIPANVVTNMSFGSLMDVGTGTLRSSPTGSTGVGSVVALISANSHSLPYTIKQTGTAMTSGTNSLPSGACCVTPVYASADNGGLAKPAGAVLGTPGSWVATDKAIYTSETGAAAMRTVQAHYSISDDPAAGSTAGVPLSQAGGSYAGTVTISVTA